MKKTLSALVGSLLGIGLLLTIAAVYPEIPTTDYTFGFMTNETAASARTYLGLPSGGVLPYTMVGTNLTAGTLAFVGTYKTNLIDGPAITSAGSNFVILANTNAMLAYLGINNITVTNRGNGIALLDTNDNSTIWLKSVTNNDGSLTLTDNLTNIDFKMSGLYKGSLAVTNALTANTIVATNGGTLGPLATSGTNATLTGSFSANTVTGTNGLTPGSFTVATLPASAPAGTMLYCSDAVTVAGTGGIVWFDGSVWRTKRNNIQATADVPTYILRCYGARINDVSALSTIMIGIGPAAPAGQWTLPLFNAASGTGAAAAGETAINSSYGSIGNYQTGTATNGYYYQRSVGFPAMALGEYYCDAGNFYVSNLSDSDEVYWFYFGLDGNNTQTWPVSGAGFAYDAALCNVTGISGTATNNWICVSGKASTYDYHDSGLPVSTSSSTFNRLLVIATTTSITFYTNGVPCYTNATANTIPTVALWSHKRIITKSGGAVGTANRVVREVFPLVHVRRATAYTLP